MPTLFSQDQDTNTFTPRDYQRETLEEIRELYDYGANRQLMVAATGLGKAQPLDAGVLTPHGWTRMGRIYPGDEVIGSDGEAHIVTGVYPQGKKPIYRLHMSDGSSVEASGDHLWSVQTKSQKHRDQGFLTKTTEDLLQDLRSGSGERKWFLPLLDPVQFPYRSVPIDPYVMGCLIGDGCFSNHYVHLSTADEFIRSQVEERLPAGYSLDHIENQDYNVSPGTTGRSGGRIGNGLRKVGLQGRTSEGKFIPDSYKYNAVDVRLGLLRGLMDTDGHLAHTSGEFSTVSRQLAEDVAEVVRSLGGCTQVRKKSPSTYTHNGEQRTGRPSYRVTVALEDVNPFLLPRKADQYDTGWKQSQSKAIEKIERVGTEPCQCIAVDAEDSLYVTDDYILTHNTISFAFLPHHFPDLYEHGMLVVVHRTELAQQAMDKLGEIVPDAKIGLEKADNYAHPDCDIVVTSVQTLGQRGSNRIERFEGQFGIIVIDEAHHCTPGSRYQVVTDYFGVGPERSARLPSGQERLLVGVTATPNRHDGESLHHFFDEICAELDIRWGIENGWLVPINPWRVDTGVDISGVSSRMGDFAKGELDEAINIEERHLKVLQGWIKYGGDQGLIFANSRDHAQELAWTFNEHGVETAYVDGNTPRDERKDIVRRYRNEEITCLSNVGIFTEGWDAPGCDTILLAQPTQSKPRYIQQIGRGTRPVVDLDGLDKEERLNAITASSKPYMNVVDFVDNTREHKLVTAPVLFDLDQDFETEDTILSAIEVIEQKEEEMPHKDFRQASSLEEVEVIAEQPDIWSRSEVDEQVKEMSDFRWIQMANGIYHLGVPATKADEDRDFHVKLKPDNLGRYSADIIYPRKWDPEEERLIPEERIDSPKTYETVEEAIEAVDSHLESEYSEIKSLIEHSPSWGDEPMTEPQRKYLNALGVSDDEIPEGCTKIRASALIDAAKAGS